MGVSGDVLHGRRIDHRRMLAALSKTLRATVMFLSKLHFAKGFAQTLTLLTAFVLGVLSMTFRAANWACIERWDFQPGL